MTSMYALGIGVSQIQHLSGYQIVSNVTKTVFADQPVFSLDLMAERTLKNSSFCSS